MIISLLHMNRFGNVLDLLPEGVNANIDNPPVDMIETHTQYIGKNYVRTDVTIRNRCQENMTIVYVYQDSAYLWFPRGSSDGIIPVVYQNTGSTSNFSMDRYDSYTICENQSAFVGYIDREHSVLSGIFSNYNGSKIGLINYYIGLEEYGIREKNNGQQFEVMTASHTQFSDIPDLSSDISLLPNYNNLKNRFVAFELENLSPGESRSFTFYRVMYYIPEKILSDEDVEHLIVNCTAIIDSNLSAPVLLPDYHPEGLPITSELA